MSAQATTHTVRIVKRKGLLTRFIAICSCGWESPPTTKDKAKIGKVVHEGGGEVVAWEAKPAWVSCPECLERAQQLYDTSDGEDLSKLPDVCETCNGSGKVPADSVETVH